MRSPSSSISTSEGVRGLAGIVLGALVTAVCVMAVNYLGYRAGRVDFVFIDLLRYQVGKIETTPPIDTLFLGDSSLGNAIDVKLFDELAGTKSLSLALTGIEGYGGSLNMLRRTLAKHKPRRVILIQALDMLTRPICYTGYARTSVDGLPLGAVPVLELLKIYANMGTFWGILKRFHLDRYAPPPDKIVSDYVIQGPRRYADKLAAAGSLERLVPADITPGKTKYLIEIQKTCAELGIPCLYLYGPVYEGYCKESREYIAESSRILRETGVELVTDTPVCVPLEELGDHPDHVRPDLKAEYTRRYHALIGPRLR